jgi:predicted membrane protein
VIQDTKGPMVKSSNTLNESLKALRNLFLAAYNLAPAVVITGLLLAGIVFAASLFFVKIKMGSIILLIIAISIIVYAISKNYGEATVSLMAGLLAAFTVEWTWNNYFIFMLALIGFLFFVLLIESLRIASTNESLYREAALYVSVSRYQEIEKQLIKISKSIPDKLLGPVEKADAIKIMAFRKVPIESMQYMLAVIQTFVGFTRLDVKTITLFLVDLTRTLNIEQGPNLGSKVDNILSLYRDAPVSDEEFILAFSNTKHFVVSGQIGPDEYLSRLISNLKNGLSPVEIDDSIFID